MIGNNIYSKDVDIYDATTGQWSVSHLSTERDMMTASAAGNKVLFTGETQDPSLIGLVDIYDMNTSLWTTTP